MSCSDPIRGLLPAWLAGELEPETAARVAAHLERCPDCAELVAALGEIGVAAADLRELDPPSGLEAGIAGSPCLLWESSLMAALDRTLPDDRLAPLLEHLESCPGCAAVWTAFTALRETGEGITVPPGLEARCRAVSRGDGGWRGRLPGARTAMAAAYAAALAVSLLLGNPVTLARSQVRAATVRIERTVRTGADTLREESRGEFRMLVWRVWRMGHGVVAAVRSALGPVDEPRSNERKGERA